MKKKNRKFVYLGILSVVLVIAVFYFNTSQSFLMSQGSGRLYNFQETSSTYNSNSYLLQVMPTDEVSSNSACGSDVKNSLGISEIIEWDNTKQNFDNTGTPIIVELPDDLRYNEKFNTSQVSFQGLTFLVAPSGCSSSVIPTYTDKGSYCIAIDNGKIRCSINGELTTGAQFREKAVGSWTLSVRVSIPKANTIVITQDDTPQTPEVNNTISEEIIDLVDSNLITDSGNVQCVDNIGCKAICGGDIPTCESNKCFCDKQEIKIINSDNGYQLVKQQKTSIFTIILLMLGLGVIILFSYSIIKRFKKKRR